jgi:Ca-activated chloride channel family protein
MFRLPSSRHLSAPGALILAVAASFIAAFSLAAAPAVVAGLALASLAAACLATPARAHAAERDRRPAAGPYEVSELSLRTEVTGQAATAVLRTAFRNPTRRRVEIDYIAPLPRGASVVSAVVEEEGRELMGSVYAREDALRMYSEAVRKSSDPSLIEYAGQDAYRARLSTVPPGKTRTLALTMSFLVPKERGACALSVPLAGPVTRQLTVGRQEAVVSFRDTPGLSNVYSPLEAVAIDREPGGGTARFLAEGQRALDHFRVFYRTGSSGLGGSLISHRPDPGEDGYFMFLAEPALDEGAPSLPKDVCFVLDVSSSMSGNKLLQAKEALRFVLDRLAPEDRFGFIHFSHETGSWKDGLVPMTPAARSDAAGYLSGLEADGWTDIGTPLKTALGMMDPSRPAYVLFLTDGQANTGVTDESGLAGLASGMNAAAARIFSFGVGYGLNARLLERFSSVTGGSTVFMNEMENIESKVAEFFSRITSPVLTRPCLSCSLPLNRMTPGRLPDLFSGGQITAVGRYPVSGEAVIELAGLEGGADRKFSYPVVFSDGPVPEASFLGALWATRRSAQILAEVDLSDRTGDGWANLRKELVGELVALARSHGILTPYTSFLADDCTDLNRQGENLDNVSDLLGEMDMTSGMLGVLERRFRGNAQGRSGLGSGQDARDVFHVRELACIRNNAGDRRITKFRDPGAAKVLKNFIDDTPDEVKAPSPRTGTAFDDSLPDVACCLCIDPSPATTYPQSGPGKTPAKKGGAARRREIPETVFKKSPKAVVDRLAARFGPDVTMVLPETIGGRAFFLKDGVLTEGELGAEEIAGATEVVQFSPEYFALVSEIPPEGLGWLSQDRPIVFRWKGAVCRIVPLASEKSA